MPGSLASASWSSVVRLSVLYLAMRIEEVMTPYSIHKKREEVCNKISNKCSCRHSTEYEGGYGICRSSFQGRILAGTLRISRPYKIEHIHGSGFMWLLFFISTR